jgi:hypothetical protein
MKWVGALLMVLVFAGAMLALSRADNPNEVAEEFKKLKEEEDARPVKRKGKRSYREF